MLFSLSGWLVNATDSSACSTAQPAASVIARGKARRARKRAEKCDFACMGQWLTLKRVGSDRARVCSALPALEKRRTSRLSRFGASLVRSLPRHEEETLFRYVGR